VERRRFPGVNPGALGNMISSTTARCSVSRWTVSSRITRALGRVTCPVRIAATVAGRRSTRSHATATRESLVRSAIPRLNAISA
jgi:hypothetical protein